MRDKKFSFIIKFLIILTYISTVFLLIVSLQLKNTSSNTKDFVPVEKITQHIRLEYSDNRIEYVNTPKQVFTKEPFSIYVDLKYFGSLHKKSVALFTGSTDFTVSLGSDVFYEYKVPDDSLIYNGGSYDYTLIDLPSQSKSSLLKIHFTPKLKHSNRYVLNNIYIGNRINFNIFLIKNELFYILVTFILLILSIISFIILFGSFLRNEQLTENIEQMKKIKYIALLSFILSIYSFSGYKTFIYWLSDYKILIHFLEYISMMFLSYPFLKLIENKLNPKFDIAVKLSIIAVFLNYFIQLALTIFKYADFEEMAPITYVILAITSIIVVIAIIFSRPEKYTERNSLFILSLPIFFAILSSFIILFIGTERYFSLVILSCVLLLICFQVYFLTNIYFKIQEKSTTIKIYEKIASIDSLTSLKNRYSFENDMNFSRKNPTKITIISVDLNNLKEINDNLGHSYGDLAIKTIGTFLKENIADSDVYRVGGDEFIIITKQDFSYKDVDMLKKQNIEIDTAEGKIKLDYAIGYDVFDPSSTMDIDDVLKSSDKKMYENKKLYKLNK